MEAVIAVAILGVVGVGFLVGLSASFLGTGTVDEQATSDRLAQSQMENVMSQPYASGYTPSVSTPQGYSLDVAATSLYDGNLQKIEVTVYREGNAEFRLEGYKVNRGQ